MAILKITEKVINEACKEDKQLPLSTALIRYLEYLSDSERSESEMLPMAEALVASYQVQQNLDFDGEND